MLWRAVTVLLAVVALAVVLVAVFGDLLVSGDPGRIVAIPYSPPGPGLPLGTDYAGRDVLPRVLAGGRFLVLVPLFATALAAVLGTALGMLGGYLGGVANVLTSRLDTLMLAVPPILVLLVLLNGWGYSTATLIAIVVITGAPFVSRVARASTLQVMQNDYVTQSIALGESRLSTVVREILPNIAHPVLADAGTRLAIAVTLTASAGFLGFGPDAPNWGAMISQNIEGISLTPWGVVVPAVLLAVVTVSANILLDRFAAKAFSR
ncbi:ABC transporter permease [Catellatospora vulcania]|uniref:ABC transporter permease n=1 Tax=Catellatospora vulcania TaxID=1460450 RepID=UPI001E284C73|nr:ABC transporter permease subunit [Catellatospora vulcania]